MDEVGGSIDGEKLGRGHFSYVLFDRTGQFSFQRASLRFNFLWSTPSLRPPQPATEERDRWRETVCVIVCKSDTITYQRRPKVHAMLAVQDLFC